MPEMEYVSTVADFTQLDPLADLVEREEFRRLRGWQATTTSNVYPPLLDTMAAELRLGSFRPAEQASEPTQEEVWEARRATLRADGYRMWTNPGDTRNGGAHTGGARTGGYGGAVHRNAYIDTTAVVHRHAVVNRLAEVYDHSIIDAGVVVPASTMVGSYQHWKLDSDGSVIKVELPQPEVRTCQFCQTSKPVTFFPVGKDGKPSKRARLCLDCQDEVRRLRQVTRQFTRTRPFGLEIEFHGDRGLVAEGLKSFGESVRDVGYSHDVVPYWKIVTDASVSGGGELVSPILRGDAGFEAIKRAAAGLKAAGARVSRATGLHVHLDVRDLNVKAFKLLVQNWHDSQEAIDGLVSPSRRGHRNGMCGPLESYDLERANSLRSMSMHVADRDLSGDRYKVLNFQSYGRYGTVEIRQHQGTLNAEKISAWVRFCMAMVSAAKRGVSLEEDDTEALIGTLEALGLLRYETVSYLTARAETLRNEERVDSEEEQVYDSGENEDQDEEDYEDDSNLTGGCDCASCREDRRSAMDSCF